MWFYFINDKRVGPVAATTIILLFQKGVIKLDTQVWNPDLRIWTKLEDSAVYYKYKNPILPQEKIKFRTATKILRALIISTIVCLFYRLMFFADTLKHIDNINLLDPVNDKLKIIVEVAQNTMMFNLTSAILVTLLVLIILYAIRWGYCCIDLSRTITASFPYSTIFAWSLILPIVNVYYPIKIAWETLIYALKGTQIKASEIIKFITWSFFWVLAIILLCVEFSGILTHKQLEQIPFMIQTRFLMTSTYIIMLTLSLAFVSKIYRLQFNKASKK